MTNEIYAKCVQSINYPCLITRLIACVTYART